MKLSILTTISDPDDRQDLWKEAMQCYSLLADEVVVVDGSRENAGYDNKDLENFRQAFIGGKYVYLWKEWEYEWNWLELPERLDTGRQSCTGDWILKMDIDQFIHERDFEKIYETLDRMPSNIDAVAFQKINMLYGNKHMDKNAQIICIRNRDYLSFGINLTEETDLCFPIRIKDEVDLVDEGLKKAYRVKRGYPVSYARSGINYYNYDYYFKTKEFTYAEFWRFSNAYYRYFGSWKFGSTHEKSFETFINLQKGRHGKAPYDTKLEDHPVYVREAVKKLMPEMFGYNGWGLCN